VEKTFVNDP